MKGASTERIIDIVRKCPTQALTYDWNDATRISDKPGQVADPVNKDVFSAGDKPATVRVMKNGPLVVEGVFRVINSDGKELKMMRMVSFCRCNQSGNMPYCDGAHRKYVTE